MPLFTLPYLIDPAPDRLVLRWVNGPDDPPGTLGTTAGVVEAVRSRFFEPLGARIHDAAVTGLSPGQRLTYQLSIDGATPEAGARALPLPDAGVRFLLTSDAQSMPLAASALSGFPRHAGPLDFILYPGDLADRPYVPEDWWSPLRLRDGQLLPEGTARGFFPTFQGLARLEPDGPPTGAPLLQHLPLYPLPGNHEVSGANGFRGLKPLSVDRSGWNAAAYDALFGPALIEPGTRRYYAFRHGNVACIMLFVSRAWRPGDPRDPDAAIYREPHPDQPELWLHGCFHFESIAPGSAQYSWLVRQLDSPAFRSASLRVVALHHPIFTAGHDHWPRFIEPAPQEERCGDRVIERRYGYPPENELLEQHLVPLFERAGVQLVVNGHSHVYSRYEYHGITYVESSNLGNTYGWREGVRTSAALQRALTSNAESYVTVIETHGGRPHGLTVCAQDGREVDRFDLGAG